jgi:hypothetical protein
MHIAAIVSRTIAIRSIGSIDIVHTHCQGPSGDTKSDARTPAVVSELQEPGAKSVELTGRAIKNLWISVPGVFGGPKEQRRRDGVNLEANVCPIAGACSQACGGAAKNNSWTILCRAKAETPF